MLYKRKWCYIYIYIYILKMKKLWTFYMSGLSNTYTSWVLSFFLNKEVEKLFRPSNINKK